MEIKVYNRSRYEEECKRNIMKINFEGDRY